MTGLERYLGVQHVAYLLLLLPGARNSLTGHPNEFKVRAMQGAALLHFSVTGSRSVSLSILLLIAVSVTPRWVTSRQSAQLGVVKIFLVNSTCGRFDILPRNTVHIQLPEEVPYYGIQQLFEFVMLI
jgi:hypothetical protein